MLPSPLSITPTHISRYRSPPPRRQFSPPSYRKYSLVLVDVVLHNTPPVATRLYDSDELSGSRKGFTRRPAPLLGNILPSLLTSLALVSSL